MFCGICFLQAERMFRSFSVFIPRSMHHVSPAFIQAAWTTEYSCCCFLLFFAQYRKYLVGLQSDCMHVATRKLEPS